MALSLPNTTGEGGAHSSQEVAPIALLRDYISWFMSGERLSERLQTSDGLINAIHVEWAEGDEQLAALELQFTNGMVTDPWFVIEGLTSADVDAVAAEIAFGSNEWLQAARGQEAALKVDAKALQVLEADASCKLTMHEALVLRRARLSCPICLGGFAKHQSILCLPCGRADEESTCLGHIGHAKCLRSEFHRRDACPLCRTPLPSHDGDDALERARCNLRHLRAEATRLHSKVAKELRAEGSAKSPAARRPSGSGAASSSGAASESVSAPPNAAGALQSPSTPSNARAESEGVTRRAASSRGAHLDQQRLAKVAATRRDDDRRWREARRAAQRGRAVTV